eukprot:3379374-Karenia_brevis.AAC.1
MFTIASAKQRRKPLVLNLFVIMVSSTKVRVVDGNDIIGIATMVDGTMSKIPAPARHTCWAP